AGRDRGAAGRRDRDRIVRAGFERMRAARPAALAADSVAARITLGNFEDDFGRVAHADWVIEAIVEQLEPKQELAARIEKTASAGALVSSNTSGIPLASIAEGRSGEFRRRFLGTHFFNPPRYLKLVELIPTADTDPEVLEAMRAFVEGVLGKGAVVAKDTPNFIANRLGSFAGMHGLRYAFEHGYSIEEVDALTGPLVGRPRTASFRLADQVGIDVMVGVADNLHRLARDDESREELLAPEPLRRLVAAGRLGIKTGGGFYRRDRRDGRTVFDVVDTATLGHGDAGTLGYRPAEEPDLPVVEAAREHRDLGERLRFLLDKAEEGDRGAVYLRDTLLPALAYASRRIPEIADSPAEVDHAMEWGFGHQAGPFRTWDLLGVRGTTERMRRLGLEVAPWVDDFLGAGNESFYRDGAAYQPSSGTYEPVRTDPDAIDLAALKAEGREVLGNDSASLVDLGDGVLCLELHAPASAVDARVIQLGHQALAELEGGDWKGLVIGGRAANFCVGANLAEVGMAAYQRAYDQVKEASRSLQELLMGFRFAAKPVVAAPHGQTLGAGCEICLHADRVVAALETYMGQVETAVGLIPAGGGCKELVRRIVSPAMRVQDAPPLPFVQRVFETIALAKVGTSAVESRELGFLADDDRIVLNADHLLTAAKREVLELAPGYRPPPREASVFAAGSPTLAALELGVRTQQWGGYASGYDGVVATHLASVLCGGELSAPQWVTEDYLLELEREAFVELLRNEKTMERIQAMLTTRKPLRN
ncbi:MAG TPA: 3-hydroxyacyl-CoA dehydrogenase/enoyl-CoA hydratase family protein, partial [Actinomycetota bacterium]|nr:3-hydroxyacyl-CoA dehydrogenase/enoyl-CoA hydratase family protein [Actinomycetota bacterium]